MANPVFLKLVHAAQSPLPFIRCETSLPQCHPTVSFPGHLIKGKSFLVLEGRDYFFFHFSTYPTTPNIDLLVVGVSYCWTRWRPFVPGPSWACEGQQSHFLRTPEDRMKEKIIINCCSQCLEYTIYVLSAMPCPFQSGQSLCPSFPLKCHPALKFWLKAWHLPGDLSDPTACDPFL